MTLHFEPNNLYILLLDGGGAGIFKWQLYLATTISGRTFYITNESSPTWQYKSEAVNMSTSGKVLLALKVGAVEPILHSALAARLGLVPLTLYSVRCRESLCCRVWVQEALFALDDEGYLIMRKSAKEFEQEAKRLAIVNKCQGVRSVKSL